MRIGTLMPDVFWICFLTSSSRAFHDDMALYIAGLTRLDLFSPRPLLWVPQCGARWPPAAWAAGLLTGVGKAAASGAIAPTPTWASGTRRWPRLHPPPGSPTRRRTTRATPTSGTTSGHFYSSQLIDSFYFGCWTQGRWLEGQFYTTNIYVLVIKGRPIDSTEVYVSLSHMLSTH